MTFCIIFCKSFSDKGSNVKIRDLLTSALLTAKKGFSVVAPIKVIDHYSNKKDSKKIHLTQDAISHLVKFSGGDARTLINALEMAIETTAENDAKEININLSIAEDLSLIHI